MVHLLALRRACLHRVKAPAVFAVPASSFVSVAENFSRQHREAPHRWDEIAMNRIRFSLVTCLISLSTIAFAQGQESDLTVSKSADVSQASPGDEITYTIQ